MTVPRTEMLGDAPRGPVSPRTIPGHGSLRATLDVLPGLLRALRQRNVPVILARGHDLGSPSAATRPVEMLVPPTRFLQAERTLSALAFRPADAREPRSYFRRSCREGVTLLRDDGARIDLLHHVPPWVWGSRLPFEVIERHSRGRMLPTGTVQVVHPAHDLMISVLRLLDDLASHAPSVDSWRTIVEPSRDEDPSTIASMAREVRLDRLLAWTLRRSPSGERLDRLIGELGDRPPSVPDQIRLRLLLGSELRDRGDLAQVYRLPIGRACGFLGGYVVPSASFLEHRFGNPLAYGSWWREALARRQVPRVAHRLPTPRSGPRLDQSTGPGSPGRARGDPSSGPAWATPTGGSSLFPSLGPVSAAALFGDLEGSPPSPVDPTAWDSELPALLHHRLAGLALAVALRDGVELHEETRARLLSSQLHSTAHALAVESSALEAIGALDARGIPCVVTKGPGIASVYPQRALRPYGDLDALVHPEWFDVALRVLHTLGYEEYFDGGEPRAYFDRYCREGVNLVRQGGGSIDLHHHVPPWVFGERLRFAELHAASSEAEVADGRVRVVHPAHNLLIAALHVISDRRIHPGHKLLTWRDVVTLAHACDPDLAASEARRMELDWFLAFILRQLPPPVRPNALSRRLGRSQPRATDAFRLRRLVPPGIGSRHQIAQAFRLPVPNAGLFLFGYVVPSREFLERRFGSRRAFAAWWRDAFLRLQAARVTEPGHNGAREGSVSSPGASS